MEWQMMLAKGHKNYDLGMFIQRIFRKTVGGIFADVISEKEDIF